MKALTAGQKHNLMTKLLATQQGRAKIAASLNEPLRQLRDYVAIGRRAFLIDELPDGTIPVYDMDPDVPAYVVGEEGDSVQVVTKSKRILVPLFELASNPKIPFTQVKERRFDIIRRVKDKAKFELFRKEDTIIFQMMQKAALANTANPPIMLTSAQFNIATMATAFAQVERHGLRVDKIFMNPAQVPVIRTAGRDYLDFETQREILRQGMIGTLWGATIMQSMQVPPGTIFYVTEPEFFGVIPVRTI